LINAAFLPSTSDWEQLSIKEIPANTMSPSTTYNFSVTVRKDYDATSTAAASSVTDTAAFTITTLVQETSAPTITFANQPERVAASDTVRLEMQVANDDSDDTTAATSLSWSLVSGPSSPTYLTSLNNSYLVISPNTLLPGNQY
jgi:hypothetical protein